MTIEELKAQIHTLEEQLDFLLKQLSDMEAKEKFRNFFNSLRNLVIWLFPLIIFIVLLVLIYSFLHMSWEEFIELFKILMWPVTILIVLFFFRKIFTYLFLSMEEFNLFGTKGRLKNIQDVINERASELRNREKIEEQQREKIEYFKKEAEKNQNLIQDLIKVKGGLEEWEKLAKEIFQDYKKLNEDHKELYKKYNEKIKQEEDIRIKKEALKRLIEERSKERRDLPF